MSDVEVLRMIGPVLTQDEGGVAPPTAVPKWMNVGDRVRVADGAFVGMEGVVKQILEAAAKVQVEVTIFGRPVNVELDFYQVEEI
jgi:transcriptional antiterminator NusG